jgi:hypothetical protein
MMNRAICNMRKIVTLLSLYKQTAILNPGNSRVHFHVGISAHFVLPLGDNFLLKG